MDLPGDRSPKEELMYGNQNVDALSARSMHVAIYAYTVNALTFTRIR